jgi:hypothetical protein
MFRLASSANVNLVGHLSGRTLAPVTAGFLWSAGFSVFWLRGIFNTACYDAHKSCTSHDPYNSGASFGYIRHAR